MGMFIHMCPHKCLKQDQNGHLHSPDESTFGLAYVCDLQVSRKSKIYFVIPNVFTETGCCLIKQR